MRSERPENQATAYKLSQLKEKKLSPRVRGEIITQWWGGNGKLPQAYESIISQTGQIYLARFKNKETRLMEGLGRAKRHCWLSFEEDRNNKLVHVFEADKQRLINSFYLVKDGEILSVPEPLQRSDIQVAQERGRSIAGWWAGDESTPEAFESSISKDGAIRLTAYEGKQRKLIGGLELAKRHCWLSFEEDGNNKLVHVFEADKQRLINSFYLVKDGEILSVPEPLQRSDIQVAQERGRSIAGWWAGDESTPEAFESSISSATIPLTTFRDKRINLCSGLGRVKRHCWLSFEEDGNNKLVHVFEADKQRLINSFYLVKDGEILSVPEPLQRSDIQVAQERGRSITGWWAGDESTPEAFEFSISSAQIQLTTFKGKKVFLIGGLGSAKRHCWLSFEEDRNNKLVHVFEADKQRLINSFYLVKDGEILSVPEPLQRSDIQVAQERGRSITGWWAGDESTPEAFESSISKDGAMQLTTFRGKQRRLVGGLGLEERPCWLTFEEDEKNKLVHVYEADRTTLVNSFYLVKDGQILEKPETFNQVNELSPRQRLLIGIGRGDYNNIASDYRQELPNMAPYWVVHARNSLIQGSLPAGEKELSLGAGTATSYLAWKNLSHPVEVIDFDNSLNMLRNSDNPARVLGSMVEPLPFAETAFSLVTIDSAFRYVAVEARRNLMMEINRVLRDGGILSITELGYFFDQEFVDDLGRLGFKILTPANYCMELEADFKAELKQSFPPKVNQVLQRFLRNCGTLIARKEGGVEKEGSSNSLFELRKIEKVSTGEGEWHQQTGEALALGQFDQLLRTRLRIKGEMMKLVTQKKRSPARERLEKQLETRVQDGVVRNRIVSIILEYSPSGSLLEIVRDADSLAVFNQQIAEFKYILRKVGRGRKSYAQLCQV